MAPNLFSRCGVIVFPHAYLKKTKLRYRGRESRSRYTLHATDRATPSFSGDGEKKKNPTRIRRNMREQNRSIDTPVMEGSSLKYTIYATNMVTLLFREEKKKNASHAHDQKTQNRMINIAASGACRLRIRIPGRFRYFGSSHSARYGVISPVAAVLGLALLVTNAGRCFCYGIVQRHGRCMSNAGRW